MQGCRHRATFSSYEIDKESRSDIEAFYSLRNATSAQCKFFA